MSWLSKAQQALGYTSSQTPQPFEVTCSCGGVVRGVRGDEFQQVWCARCGEPCFVLPVDVYPPPKPPPVPKKKPVQKKPAEAGPPKARRSADSPAVVRDSRPSAGERLKQRVQAVKADIRRQAQDTREEASAGLREAVALQKAMFTPFRLVILGMIAVVAGTGYWVVQRNAVERAEITLREASEAGYTALEHEDFLAASREFRRACEALAVLGREDAKAAKLRQMLRETTAANQLLTKPLFEVLHELPQASHRDPAHWQDEFRREYGDQWLVLETTVRRSTADDPLPDGKPEEPRSRQNDGVVVEYPLMLGGKPVIVELDGTLLDALDSTSEPKRVIFAAQLQSCSLRGENPQRWIVTLRGDKAFLWSSFDTLQALGFDFPDDRAEQQARQLLQEQSRMMGIDS